MKLTIATEYLIIFGALSLGTVAILALALGALRLEHWFRKRAARSNVTSGALRCRGSETQRRQR